jgi:hypothetical protein
VFLHLRHLSSGLPHSQSVQETVPILEDVFSPGEDSHDRRALQAIRIDLEIIDTHIIALVHTGTVRFTHSHATLNRLLLVDWTNGDIIEVRKFLETTVGT